MLLQRLVEHAQNSVIYILPMINQPFCIEQSAGKFMPLPTLSEV